MKVSDFLAAAMVFVRVEMKKGPEPTFLPRGGVGASVGGRRRRLASLEDDIGRRRGGLLLSK